MKLKKFGGQLAEQEHGLGIPISHIEALAKEEEETITSVCGPKMKRLQLVEKALELLNQAHEMGGDE